MSGSIVAVTMFAGMLAGPPAAAHGYNKGDLNVRHPWVRVAARGETAVAGYMEIRNSGREPDRLIGASTPYAQRIDLHAAKRDGDSAQVRVVKALEIPARRRLILRPDGSHLSIVGLKKPLVKGGRIPVVLRFARAGELRVELEIQAADSKRAQH